MNTPCATIPMPSKRLPSPSAMALMFFLAVVTALPLTGCESDESRALADAQSCIDRASPSQASLCSAMVNGLTGSAAYAIRCSAHYLANGFTGARFAAAFQQIKTATGTVDPMTSAMGYLVFPATSGIHGSDTTLSDCSLSASTSLKRIAILTSFATFIASQTGAALTPAADGSLTPAQMKQAVQAFSGNPAVIGDLAIQANTAFCAPGSSLAGNRVCTDLTSAVTGGASTTTIGTALLSLLGS